VSQSQLGPTFDATAGTALSETNLQRARDRMKVQRIRAEERWLRLLWLLAGPGVIVMLAENDGPSIVCTPRRERHTVSVFPDLVGK